MRTKSASQVIAFLALAVMTTDTAGAWQHQESEKVRVHFLATSTLIRGSWGLNEDTYLAQLYFTKQQSAVLVRLIDKYPNEWSSLSREALKSNASTTLFVKRDVGCDRPFRQMILRTAPGDPLATLPEKLGFQPTLEPQPAPEAVLPRYRVSRR